MVSHLLDKISSLWSIGSYCISLALIFYYSTYGSLGSLLCWKLPNSSCFRIFTLFFFHGFYSINIKWSLLFKLYSNITLFEMCELSYLKYHLHSTTPILSLVISMSLCIFIILIITWYYILYWFVDLWSVQNIISFTARSLCHRLYFQSLATSKGSLNNDGVNEWTAHFLTGPIASLSCMIVKNHSKISLINFQSKP